jgi:hypothetical protein
MTGCDVVNVNVNGQQVDVTDPGSAVQSAKKAAGATACQAIRAKLNQQYVVAGSNTLNADVSVSFGSLVQKLGLKCPSGGVYEWDSAAKVASCTVHGQ